MDFTLSKQQQMVQKMYREFAENEVKPLAKKVDAEEYFPKETVEKMGKLGMMGIYFPTSVGGAGGDVLITEENLRPDPPAQCRSPCPGRSPEQHRPPPGC